MCLLGLYYGLLVFLDGYDAGRWNNAGRTFFSGLLSIFGNGTSGN